LALAEALGDTPHTVISTQLLRRGLCKAYVAGPPSRFRGAIVQARDFADEPTGYGSDALVIWELLQSVDGWFCILVSTACAPKIGALMERELGVRVRYIDDVCFTMNAAAPQLHDPAVRLLTLDDLDMLEDSPAELRASCYADTRDLLTHGIVACAVVSGEIVATALAAARSAKYAEVGVFTQEGHRGRGFATVAAALVCAEAQAQGQQPVWSAGSHNAASLRVAHKLGFVEYGRGRYVIAIDRETGRSSG
jgi:hypothetical protein